MDPNLGNVVISDLFSRFLELVLSEVAEISRRAGAGGVPLAVPVVANLLVRQRPSLRQCSSRREPERGAVRDRALQLAQLEGQG